MARSLVHPRLRSSLNPRFFNAECTIYELSDQRSPVGQPTPTLIVHLEAIPCRIATASGSERRQPAQTIATHSHRIVLNSYAPTITPAMRAEVGGVAYDIVAVEHDSERIMTYLNVFQVLR